MSNLPSTDQDKSGPPQADPLESLHKMSRTAGLGSQEYVAVNTTAVVALIMGLASASVIMSPVLLALPVATIIVAIFAIRQVSNSAGTQTGKGLAILGMIIALAFVALVGGRELIHDQRVKREQSAINALIEQLGKNLNTANFEAAWTQFDSRFKEHITHDGFVNHLASMLANPNYGRVESVHSTGILDVQIEPESGMMTANGFIIFNLPGNQQDRRDAMFRKAPEGDWLFEDIGSYFPQPKQQPDQEWHAPMLPPS